MVYRGGYGDRVGIREGYTGVVPTQHAARGGKSPDSGAGPGSPAGAGVGGLGAGRTYLVFGGGDGSWDHLRPGRSPLVPSLSQDP